MKKSFFLQKGLSKLRILPSWVIFIIDVFLLSFSGLINYYFFRELGVAFYDEFPFKIRLGIVIFVYSFYFLLFKTYSGIIRYSTLSDIGRLFKSVFFSLITLLLVDLLYFLYFDRHIFLTYTLIYSGFFIFFTLISFRVFVKKVFQYFGTSKNYINKESIAIVGVNSKNISLIESLSSDDSLFNVICFIDTNSALHGKKVAGISIVSFQDKPFLSYLRLKGIKSIVLTKGYLDETIEKKLIEDCLIHRIKVYKPDLIESKGEHQDTLKAYNLEELLFRDSIHIENPKIKDRFVDKTILVTGGAGSIGSELVKQLSYFKPKKLIVLDHAETPLYEIELFLMKKIPNVSFCFELVDVSNKEELEAVFIKYQPNIIFHAAAYKHVPMLEKNFKQAIKVNVFGTRNCLNLAVTYGIEKFVLISTDKAVNPTNIMGATKRFAEILGQITFQSKDNFKKTQIMTTRFGNVLGSNGSVVHLFKKQIKEGGPITVTHPEINRFFMTIPEACKLVIEAGAMGVGGQTYLFDMGEPIKIKDLAEKMIRLSGKTPNKDIKIVYTGLRPGEKLYEEILTDYAETLPTYNSKIVIAREEISCAKTAETVYNNLKPINNLNRDEVLDLLKSIVPGFHPDSTIK